MTPEEEDRDDAELDALMTILIVIVVALTCSIIFLSMLPAVLDFALRYFTP